MDILGASEGIVIEHVPTEAKPGDFVLDPARLATLDEDVLAFLQEHAEEIGLRVAVPNPYDTALKPHEDVGLQDYKAIQEHLAADARHADAQLRHMENIVAMLREHSDNPEAKVKDVLEEKGGKLTPKPPKDEDE